MKNKIYFLLALSPMFIATSCIEEVALESKVATQEQVGSSAAALEGSINGIPAQMAQGYLVYGEQEDETDMGYPQFMIAQTEMLGDMYAGGTNYRYDWYYPYNSVATNIGPTSENAFLPWFTLYKFIKSANDVIGSVDLETANKEVKGLAGVAYACRAFDYYMLMVLFEPKTNIYTDCSKVLGLTVPVVDENTDEEKAKNNPRLPHADMVKYILSDLDKAEEYLQDYTPVDKKVPDLAVTYGIKAKVYMWDEDYANAAKYARMAIDASGASPVTEAQLDDPATGFNKANQAWMWYLHYDAENMGNLCNFTGWASGEADWGYSSLTCPMIDKSLYDKMSATDIRRRLFLDPAREGFYNYKTCRDQEWLDEKPDYLALKFRCVDGNFETYTIGGICDVPVMRVEEMYLIEAEAVGASQSVSTGVALLNDFMQKNRDKAYNYAGTDLRSFQLEVLTQMRLEFWGEGCAFPNAKRLEPDVIQNYEGTNAPADIFKINCKGIKPNWTLCIPQSEVESNVALDGMNNPDPSKTVTGPTEIGTFAPANN